MFPPVYLRPVPPRDEVRAAPGAGLVGSPSARSVTLPAGRAVRTHLRAAVVVKARRVVADINQFAFLRARRSIVLTYTTGARGGEEDGAGDRPLGGVDPVRVEG